ncbi:MAG: MATE family efflux transporter [Roseburia sp.]|nr:MATE family efflux transporter [Roseburia sp.]
MAGKISIQKRNMILEGNLFKAIITLAVPIMLNSFIQTMYNLTDTYWLGKIGTDPMAAITLVSPVQNIIINFGQGITTAGAILISQYIGAGERKQSVNMANHLFICSMVFSVVCAFLCMFATPGIVGWLGAEGNLYKLGVTYLKVVVLDMPFLFTINMYNAVHQSQGDTVRPMLMNLLGIAINFVLDPLLMVVLDLGILGAALATLAAKIPPALLCLRSLFKHSNDENISLSFKDFKFEADKLKSIIKIGLPTAIGGSTMQFGFLLMTRNVLKYGSIATAAYGIGNKINSIITLPANGIGSAVSTIVGQNMGAQQVERANKGYKMAMLMAFIFLLVGGMILSRRPVSQFLVNIFTDDPIVSEHATDFLSLMAFWCWTNSIYNSTLSLFQGSGHTVITMLVDASRLWVFRFLTLFICESVLMMGVESIWYSVVVSNGTSAFILLILYFTGIWRKSTVKIQRQENMNEAS